MIKRMKIRWTLFWYDCAIFLVSIGLFFGIYRGSLMKDNVDLALHAGIAFACIFGARMAGRVYQQIWRYGGVENYLLLLSMDGLGCFFYMLLNALLPAYRIANTRVISIVAVNVICALGMRMAYRYAYKNADEYTRNGRLQTLLLHVFAGKKIVKERNNITSKKNIAIVGAGRTGVCLAEALLNNRASHYVPVCFLDKNEKKVGRMIHGIPVLSETNNVEEKLRDLNVKQIVFAVPRLPESVKHCLYNRFKAAGFDLKIYDEPTIKNTDGQVECLDESAGKLQFREFSVEDVLFRNTIAVTNEKTSEYYTNKVILVTGGGGSIGSELARQVAAMKPSKLVLLDVYENGVYDLRQDLCIKYGNKLNTVVEIVSITSRKNLEKVFAEHRPEIVIHAAAHKHVPLMERNCIEAVENNVFGTLNVVQLCEKYEVKRFMMLSTDKAVNPTNVMGATKRMCEFIVLAHSTMGKVKYSATRFGNVLGSAGSVIPLFKRQIAAGGPVTITDKRITRYFMTIPEASQLVLQSGQMAANGDLFVLDMGQSVKILDLAENMIRLSGYTPYEEIDIQEIGLRPGEKLYEELLVRGENLSKTENDLIFIEKANPITMEELEEKLAVLKEAIGTDDNEVMREALRKVVPTFYRPEEVNKEVRD